MWINSLLKRGFLLRFTILFTSTWTGNNTMNLATSLNYVFYHVWLVRAHILWWHRMFVQSLLIFPQFIFLIFKFPTIPTPAWVGNHSYNINIAYASLKSSSLWCSAKSGMNLICSLQGLDIIFIWSSAPAVIGYDNKSLHFHMKLKIPFLDPASWNSKTFKIHVILITVSHRRE